MLSCYMRNYFHSDWIKLALKNIYGENIMGKGYSIFGNLSKFSRFKRRLLPIN